MPIYSATDGIFSGRFEGSPDEWRDFLPGLSLGRSLSVEGFDGFRLTEFGPALQAGGGLVVRDGQLMIPNVAANYLNRVGARNIATALRSVVGQLATTVGYWATATTSVAGIYQDPLATAVDMINVMSQVINSDYFQQALEGVTFIPIVGWIIRIVAEVLKIIAQISEWAFKRRMNKMEKRLADRFMLPVLTPDDGAELQEFKMSTLLDSVRMGNLEYLFLPAYLAPGFGDWSNFVGIPAGKDVKTVGKNQYELQSRWYLRTRTHGGLGFVAGTSSINDVLEFVVGRCGTTPRSIGELMPSVQTTAGYVWQNVVMEQPAAFGIRADVLKREWINYVSSSLLFAVESLNKGYTCSATAKFDSDREECGPWNMGAPDASRGNKPCKQGKRLTISGDGHADKYLDYIIQLFWGRGATQNDYPLPVRDSKKDGQWPENFYYDNMTVSEALDNLKARQEAMLLGPQAFFVHAERDVNLEGRVVTPYPALAYDSGMKTKWERSVTEMLNETPPGWLQQNVYLSDVPRDSPLYNILKDKGVPEFPAKGPGTQLKMPGGTGAVKPPKPPEQSGTGTKPARMPLSKKKKTKGDGMSTGQKVAAGAAVAAAGYIAWRVATGRKTFSIPKLPRLPKLPGRS